MHLLFQSHLLSHNMAHLKKKKTPSLLLFAISEKWWSLSTLFLSIVPVTFTPFFSWISIIFSQHIYICYNHPIPVIIFKFPMIWLYFLSVQNSMASSPRYNLKIHKQSFNWHSNLWNHNDTIINRDTPELRIFWVFPANPGVQTNFYS